MKARTRSIALRALTGSVITSQMSVSEIQELIRELRSGQFGYELANILEFNIDIMFLDGLRKSESEFLGGEQIDYLMSLVKRKRLSKGAVIDTIFKVSGDDFRFRFNDAMSLREIMSVFSGIGTAQQVKNFIDLTEGGGAGDPYLAGITAKLKGK